MRIEDSDLCKRGLNVLIASLGSVEAERFIMIMNQGAGDYTEWRKKHLYQGVDVKTLAERARKTGETIRSMALAGI